MRLKILEQILEMKPGHNVSAEVEAGAKLELRQG